MQADLMHQKVWKNQIYCFQIQVVIAELYFQKDLIELLPQNQNQAFDQKQMSHQMTKMKRQKQELKMLQTRAWNFQKLVTMKPQRLLWKKKVKRIEQRQTHQLKCPQTLKYLFVRRKEMYYQTV